VEGFALQMPTPLQLVATFESAEFASQTWTCPPSLVATAKRGRHGRSGFLMPDKRSVGRSRDVCAHRGAGCAPVPCVTRPSLFRPVHWNRSTA